MANTADAVQERNRRALLCLAGLLACKYSPHHSAHCGKLAMYTDSVPVYSETVTLAYFHHWLADKTFVDGNPAKRSFSLSDGHFIDRTANSTLSFPHLINLYIFAGMRDIPRLANAVCDAVILKVKLEKILPDAACILDIWTRCAEQCALRRLLVDVLRPLFRSRRGLYYGAIWHTVGISKDSVLEMAASVASLGLEVGVGAGLYGAAQTGRYHVE